MNKSIQNLLNDKDLLKEIAKTDIFKKLYAATIKIQNNITEEELKKSTGKFNDFQELPDEDLKSISGGGANNVIKKLLSGGIAVLMAAQPLATNAIEPKIENISKEKTTFSQAKDFTFTHKGTLIALVATALLMKVFVTSATFLGIWVPNTVPEGGEFEKFVTEKQLFFKDIKIGDLVGRSYTSMNPVSNQLEGKYVIIYGGNGGQVEGWLDFYKIFTDRSATIVCVDYRGFGRSELLGSPFRISEKTVYEDAEKIYKYVRSGMGTGKAIDPKDIILQGYSLGGPVAAYVAEYASCNGEKLSGVIIASPLDEVHNVAERSAGTCVAGLIDLFNSSDFRTEHHLKGLARYDYKVPLYLCSGDIYKRK
ncbi:MAG: alpha/beta hydrolase [Oscillospiraceae bacterium]|jgi:predicted alpha/beta-fold hydrolase|nr:alpha/beta hydrolase [Oscillospiraceae bacterium]